MPQQRHIISWPEERIDMAFRLIPAGSFRMGSRGVKRNEEPSHLVHMIEDYYIAETPITQSQFALWILAEKIGHKNYFEGHSMHPAENMNWFQSMAFCEWLTRNKGNHFPDGYTLACLPTEAQWEYACRAETETEYYTGDGEAALDEAGWYGEVWGSGSTHPVKQKLCNAYGLYDMHGNVWEWCRDVYDLNAFRKRNVGWLEREWTATDTGMDMQTYNSEVASENNALRIVRGGSWHHAAFGCRSSFRGRGSPQDSSRDFGFRVCLVRGPAAGRGAQETEKAEAEPAPGDGGRGTRPESEGAGAADATMPDLSKAKMLHETSHSNKT